MSFSFDNYSELKSSVATYMHRDDLTELIPGFIKLAESEMNRFLRPWRLEATATIAITSGTDTAALPARTREVKSVFLTGNTERELTKMSLAQLNNLYRNQESGNPVHYALSGDNLVLGPTPSESGSLSALVIKAVSALSDANTTNAILTNYPDVYLYGAAKHGYMYLRNSQRAQEANQAFMTGIEEANRESRKFRASGVPDGRRHIGRGNVV